jgi:hypothetical protein
MFVDEDEAKELLFADGFEDALIGVTDSWDSSGEHPIRAVYDGPKVIAALVQQGMTEEAAQEYFDFNVAGAYVGKHTPIFVWPYENDDPDLAG